MKIDPKLNLVCSIERSEGGSLFVHSAPISRQVFESYYLVLSKSFSTIYGEGLSVLSGPRVAALVIRQIAQEANQWDGPSGVERGLMAEMWRLTNVCVATETGWETLPYPTAIKRELLSDEEQAEVEGKIAFFILNSAMHRRAMLRTVLDGMNGLWGTSLTLLGPTEFCASLTTSTVDENSGAMAVAS